MSFGGRAIVVEDGGAVSYVYRQPDDVIDEAWTQWLLGRPIDLPSGSDPDAALPIHLHDADEQGRLLIRAGAQVLWRFDLNSWRTVGPPIRLVEPWPKVARMGTLHGCAVVVTVQGHYATGFGLYDAETGGRIADFRAGSQVYAVAVAPPDSIVLITQEGRVALSFDVVAEGD